MFKLIFKNLRLFINESEQLLILRIHDFLILELSYYILVKYLIPLYNFHHIKFIIIIARSNSHSNLLIYTACSTNHLSNSDPKNFLISNYNSKALIV